MSPMYSGAAAAFLAGAVTLSLFRYRASDDDITALLNKRHTLSVSSQKDFDEVNSGPDPTGTRVRLSWRDLNDIFWNSRLWVRVANSLRVREPENLEWAAILHSMREAHAKTRRLILLSAIELIVGRLGLGMYARVLLWTYGEELELLSLISERCSPLEGTAIRQAIL